MKTLKVKFHLLLKIEIQAFYIFQIPHQCVSTLAIDVGAHNLAFRMKENFVFGEYRLYAYDEKENRFKSQWMQFQEHEGLMSKNGGSLQTEY